MYESSQLASDYRAILLSLTSASEEEIVKEYATYGERKAKGLYFQILIEIKESITANNLENLKKFCNLISIISAKTSKTTLNSYIENEENPIKNTNLIILACKHRNVESLEYILGNRSHILDNLSTNIGVPFVQPNDKDDECHNSFYYAICSNNIDLVDTLIKKWPNNHFDNRLNELDEILSETYEELKLKNIFLSDEVQLVVESRLIDLRFFSDQPKGTCHIRPSLDNVKDRIELILTIINLIETEYTEKNDVDDKFLFATRFIAQNIYILKKQFQHTYYVLPCEEMEFCLVTFVKSRTIHREIYVLCNSILTKKIIINHLKNFAVRLSNIEVNETNQSKSIRGVSREKIVKNLCNAYPPFAQLYNDYETVANIYALQKIYAYIELAMMANSKQEDGRLIIIRALQIIGEHLKNTLESPNLPIVTGKLLLLLAPKNASEILKTLRNSLSHTRQVSEESEIEISTDIFVGAQNDLKKIGAVISNILLGSKMKICRIILKRISKCTNFQEMREIVEKLGLIDIKKLTRFQTTQQGKIKEIIQKLDTIICEKNDFEKEMMKKINGLFISEEDEEENNEIDYWMMISVLQVIRNIVCSIQTDDDSSKKTVKSIANKVLQNDYLKMKVKRMEEIAEMTVKIANSATPRLQPKFVNEVSNLVLKVLYVIHFEVDNVEWIERLQKKLSKGKTEEKQKLKSNNEKEPNITVNAAEEEWVHQLATKLSILENVLISNVVNNDLIKEFPSYKNDKKLQAAVENIIQDIMSILEKGEGILKSNFLLLDENSPLLIGKELRNHLAHGNNLIDILPFDPTIAILLNAKKFVSARMMIKNTTSIGKVNRSISLRFQEKYNQNLQIIENQGAMFTALEEGDFQALKYYVKNGADINARNVNLWTALHFASKGPNLDMVKFIFIRIPISKDTRGLTALHVAAANGNINTVQFFVETNDFKINDTNNYNQTPLHLAAQNGHTDVVKALLHAGAKTLKKDKAGFCPLHYAIINNHKEVFNILFDREKNVDANETMGGFTPLHLAAENGCLEIINVLIESGANMDAKTDKNCTPLHIATIRGHFEVVQALVSNGADFRTKIPIHNCTLFHYAAENGDKNMVKVLLKQEASVNDLDVVHYTKPLHYAVKGGSVEIVELLLKQNADINAVTVAGVTPLHFAAFFGHREIVELLIKGGAQIDFKDGSKTTPLLVAGRCGQTEIVELLIANGACISAKDSDGNTALHLSSINSCKEVAEALIKNGAKINVKNNDGITPLHFACVDFSDERMTTFRLQYAMVTSNSDDINKRCDGFLRKNDMDINVRSNRSKGNNAEIVELLVDNGAYVNAACESNVTALHLAAVGGNVEIMEILIKRQADVNAEGNNVGTPLHAAVIGNQKEAVELLILNRANVNAKDYDGKTPLYYAIKENSKNIVRVLIKNGADVNCDPYLKLAVTCNLKTIVEILLKDETIIIPTQTDDLLLHLVAKLGFRDIVEILIANGCDINGVNDSYFTPLHLAAQEGHKEVVEVLLESKANLNPWTKLGGTPLHLAAGQGHNEIVELLLNSGGDINIKDNENRTSTELAAAHGHLQVVKKLLRWESINLNASDCENSLVLYSASQVGQRGTINHLVDAHAEVHAKRSRGLTYMHIAAREGHAHVVEFFLTNGCHINDHGEAGRTLLHYATAHNQLEMVKYLLEQDIDINAFDDNDSMPIHLAVENDFQDIIQILLMNGAIYNDIDKYNQKPIDLAKNQMVIKLLRSIENLFKAAKRNNVFDVEMCIKEGAIVNAKDCAKVTALHDASSRGCKEVFDILLKHQANRNVTDADGLTPLHYAAKFSHLEIVKDLLLNGAKFNVLSHHFQTPLDLAQNRKITDLLLLVEKLFTKIHNGDPNIISDLIQVKDSGIIKPVLNARNREGKTLMIAAVCNDFPKYEKLKQIFESDDYFKILKASNLRSQGKYQESANIYQCIVLKREGLLGPDNPCTLNAQACVAEALYKQNKYVEAINMFQATYEKQKAVLGKNHKDTLRTRYFVAAILYGQGKTDEALEICQEVYERQKEMFGESDYYTLDTKFLMVLVLNGLRRYDEALSLNYEVLEKRRETLGASHPKTLSSQENIASVLRNQEKYEEAYKIFEQLYEKGKQTLGPMHPVTLMLLYNMAEVRYREGKHEEALSTFREVFKQQKYVLGSDHLDALNTQCSIAQVLFYQGKYFAAYRAYNSSFNQRLAILGPDHPNILYTRQYFKYIHSMLKLQGLDIANVITYIQKDIFAAANDGDINLVQDFISENIDVNITNAEGLTPLHFAAYAGYKDIVNSLLRNGADVARVSKKGNTPLHSATSNNKKEIIEILLKHTKQTNYDKYWEFLNAKTTNSGSTSLHIAVKKGYFEIVKCLMNYGVTYNVLDKSNKIPLDYSQTKNITDLLNLTEELFGCAEKGNNKLFNELNQLSYDEISAITYARNVHGETALVVALRNKNKDLAATLIKMLKEKST